MARADLGAIETCWGLPSFSPLIDLRRALRARIMSVCLFFDIKIDLTERSFEQEKREGSVVDERRWLWL